MYCVASVMMNGNTFSHEYTTPLNADSSTASTTPLRSVIKKPVCWLIMAIAMPTVASKKPVERSMAPPSMMNVMPMPMMTRYAFWPRMFRMFAADRNCRPATIGPRMPNMTSSAMSTSTIM